MADPGESTARRRTERRLAAILAADVAGYSPLMEADELRRQVPVSATLAIWVERLRRAGLPEE